MISSDANYGLSLTLLQLLLLPTMMCVEISFLGCVKWLLTPLFLILFRCCYDCAFICFLQLPAFREHAHQFGKLQHISRHPKLHFNKQDRLRASWCVPLHMHVTHRYFPGFYFVFSQRDTFTLNQFYFLDFGYFLVLICFVKAPIEYQGFYQAGASMRPRSLANSGNTEECLCCLFSDWLMLYFCVYG